MDINNINTEVKTKIDIDSNISPSSDTDIDTDISVNDIIINVLEDHGYKGIDLLNQLVQIYNIYQAKHIKQFIIKNYNYFVILKDSIWFNFEHKGEKIGLSSLRDFGTIFPNLTHLFDGINIVPNIYLSALLKEIQQVLQLWNDKDIILANIYTDNDIEVKGGIDNSTKIIIYNHNENPYKYLKNLDKKIDNYPIFIAEEQYVFCKLLGKINKDDEGKILYNMLIDLQDSVNSAIQYHKDLNLIIEDN